MDIDFLRCGIADHAALARWVEHCAAIEDPSDGVIFEPSTISVESIRDATQYVGTRTCLKAWLANVRQTIQIDFGVGDADHPQPQVIEYPALLKNSRMKDFYDLWILSRTPGFSGHDLSQAIRFTFARPKTSVPTVVPLALTAEFYGNPVHVRQWGAFVRRIGEAGLADDFSPVAYGLAQFLMPVAKATATSMHYPIRWEPPGPWQ